MKNALQRKAGEFARTHFAASPIAAQLLDLTSEVGELAKAYLEATDYGKRPPVDTAGARDELGDVFYSFLVIANHLEVNIDDLLDATLDKYAQRVVRRE